MKKQNVFALQIWLTPLSLQKSKWEEIAESDTTEQLNNNIRKSTLKHIIYLKRKSKTVKTFIRKYKRKSSR